MHNVPKLARISRAKVSHSLRLRILLFAAMATQAAAQTIPVDDFSDGNDDGWNHFDLIPETYGPAIFDASAFEYRLASTGVPDPRNPGIIGAAWTASDDPFYSNGLVRLKFRINEVGTQAGIQMRVTGLESLPDLDTINFYSFGAFYVGGENGNGFGFGRTEAGNVTFGGAVQRGGLDLNEEWMLEAGIVGDGLSMKFWPVGEPEPADPQWEWSDPNPLGTGMLGLRVLHDSGADNPGRLDVTFDDILFTPVVDLDGCNGDGVIDIEDTQCATADTIDAILAAANLIQGDADGNGKVDFADFLTLSINFDQDGNYQQGNFDLIAGIEFADFLILSGNFGQAGGAVAAVPEPAGSVLVLFGVFALAWRRRGCHDRKSPATTLQPAPSRRGT